ncbi:hypothetical protein BAE36_29105 [Rhizobium leguminosarum bv. trifolii]|uniref:DUF5666 domain-containing protein n=1 Tax=Rhizobium leguminosarum bv. trifolii TaxID=386 RepID=A0A1B8R4T2_RHILT|nr:hypothetical protein [Rhizobium leguminosarum]AOO93460.1 hypothetical protein [Rhizobium leguminosarum bv. trifolii]MBY5912910.1 hypothetical protein [Rhizobium leguminosarum]OBY03811.1 hypothetical protein BAE36_29105 [Rhizobium leguminosarum bv. trifolii]TBE53689.1 hypothetical protein ELH04_04330 [Rhizobium leguminosarum]TBE91339.1 hypothetical protein ELG97_05240 [Rhizobium leguminosarum]
MIKTILPALLLGLTAIASTALPAAPVHAEDQKAEDQKPEDQKPEQIHVRGSIVSYSGSALKVKTREGETVDVTLADGWKLASVANAAVTDIKPGDFVGIASLPSAGGGDGALEVLIFPPAMKGAGEGSYGWDLKPNSSMTNATVADAVKGVDGRTVTVSYHGKEKKIAIPDGTPVVTIAPATKDDLVADAVVFIPAEKAASGPLAHQVLVGKNGVVPPM